VNRAASSVATATSGKASQGFSPLIGNNAKVLILGSLPSRQSLEQQEYYANPRNAFWRIMGELTSLHLRDTYSDRCNTLILHGLSLWDVLKSSVRPGSLDSAIELASARENDFREFLTRHKEIKLIGFNGKKSRQLFDQLVLKSWSLPRAVELVNLPSSSPANAAMSFEKKLECWSVVAAYLDPVNPLQN
jgi:TDG/mug DNA glycosylase family protein